MPGFQSTSVNITLKNRHILSARCEKPDGSWGHSELDLNHCLGNNNGRFVWGGADFADSAAQVRLVMESKGSEGVPYLHAELNDRHGSQQSASVDLTECIRNEAGALHYMGC